MLSTFATLSVNFAKHLVVSLEFKLRNKILRRLAPQNDRASAFTDVHSKMADTFTFRTATLADIPTIIAHRRAMFEEMGYRNRAELDLMNANVEDWYREKMERNEYIEWFALDDAGKIVAGAGLWVMDSPPHPTDPSTRRGNILNVYTHPDYRRRELAKRLTLTILDWCREHGIRTVILHASDEGRTLYESLGFRPTNEMRIQLSVPN